MKKKIVIEMREDNEPTDIQIYIIDDNQSMLKVNGGKFDGFMCDVDGQRVHAFKMDAKTSNSIKAIVTINQKIKKRVLTKNY